MTEVIYLNTTLHKSKSHYCMTAAYYSDLGPFSCCLCPRWRAQPFTWVNLRSIQAQISETRPKDTISTTDLQRNIIVKNNLHDRVMGI